MKGAFTGAIADKNGKIAIGGGGTLFLDEIGNLERNHQGKLLRFLQERNYTRTGEMLLKKLMLKSLQLLIGPI